jgi:pimeloyl-ACP methyl ester carboxylesterase
MNALGEKLDERIFHCGGRRLNVLVGPDNGPPLVLFHGVTRCWQEWQPLLPALTGRWQVFALDHRGHGNSERVPDAYRVEDFAGDAVAFVRSHLGRHAAVWGHSLGSMVAAMVAARVPERVGALVLEDPPGTLLASGLAESRYILQFKGIQHLLAAKPDAATLARQLSTMPVQHPRDGRVVEFRELRDEAALRFSAECLVRMDPTVIDVLLAERWLEGLDWFGELPRIACPTLLLRADVDCGGMLSESEAARIEQFIPQCRRIDRPGLGHNLHTADPQGTLAFISDFFASFHSQSLRT